MLWMQVPLLPVGHLVETVKGTVTVEHLPCAGTRLCFCWKQNSRTYKVLSVAQQSFVFLPLSLPLPLLFLFLFTMPPFSPRLPVPDNRPSTLCRDELDSF